jgi:hypothetical protein
VIAFLQMGSQSVRAVLLVLALALAAGCGNSANPSVSFISLPADGPDLSLQGVAFARLSEGQVVARGTAERLDYRRAGGRLVASRGSAIVHPEPGSALASFGTIRVVARDAEGEIPGRRGSASGGVRLDAVRGDTALTDRIEYEGDLLRSTSPVVAHGPGYRVNGKGLSARTDGSAIQLTNGVEGQLQMEARP